MVGSSLLIIPFQTERSIGKVRSWEGRGVKAPDFERSRSSRHGLASLPLARLLLARPIVSHCQTE